MNEITLSVIVFTQNSSVINTIVEFQKLRLQWYLSILVKNNVARYGNLEINSLKKYGYNSERLGKPVVSPLNINSLSLFSKL